MYGPNPRFTVDAARGAAQIDAAAGLLAERAAAVLRGEPLDPFEDLRTFVERYWPEALLLAGRAGSPGDATSSAALLLTNPGPVSRYLSGLSMQLDGASIPSTSIELVNPTVGETGVGVRASELGPERGFYIRRQQTAEVRLPGQVAAGWHEVHLVLSLAGVTETVVDETVEFL